MSAQQEHVPLTLFEWRREQILHVLLTQLGQRRSRKVSAMIDIVELFCTIGSFNRQDVLSDLGEWYIPRLIDRALADMEACGMLECVEANERKLGGGAVFKIVSPDRWHRPDPALRERRRERSGRGRPRQDRQ